MQKNTIITLCVALIIGLGIGYGIGAGKPMPQTATAPMTQTTKSAAGTHMMPDGTMMANNQGGMDMSSMMMDMNAALEGKTGDAFDYEFITQMIVHHEGAIQMAELALKNAGRQEIKDLAVAIVEAQTSEIASMKAWKKTWYGQ